MTAPPREPTDDECMAMVQSAEMFARKTHRDPPDLYDHMRQAARWAINAYAAPAPSADKHRFDVFRICDAYESGIGHGLKRDGLCNPYPPASDDFRAYEIGYEEGARRAIDDESQAPAKASAEPPATDASEMAKLLRMYYQASLPEPNVFDDDVARAADLIERQACEIADTRAMLQNTNRDAARLAHLADKYKWQVRDTCTRAERAEAERDAMRECVRELVACADESDSLAAERLYGKPHTPEYKTRELDHRQRSIEAWKAARAKVPK